MLYVILLLFVFSYTQAITWTEDYIEAVLDTRQCLNMSYIAILDSLFVNLDDMSLVKLHYAKGLDYMAQKIHRGNSLCMALVETSSFIYRDIQFAKHEAIRLIEHENVMAEKAASVASSQGRKPKNIPKAKEISLYDPVRNPTLEHIAQLLSSGTIKSQCDAIVTNEKRHIHKIKHCIKEKRKAAIFVYTRFPM